VLNASLPVAGAIGDASLEAVRIRPGREPRV